MRMGRCVPVSRKGDTLDLDTVVSVLPSFAHQTMHFGSSI